MILGRLYIQTGKFTGRSPVDKFIVSDEEYSAIVDWNDFNQALAPYSFFPTA
ncbi:phosphoenolpyruvate carboxykinase (ATP) [Mucilaginibacter litoreus]|uniref:Phosphoenolpyruvate carboxykinase (ATP) n=1 Tax=Mucilaginibacter litoreus TaxID=1048221 RepID=A0ABW3AV23_9SPHI